MSDALPPGDAGHGALDLFLVAGEVSGDELGAHLIEALQSLRDKVAARGVGGPAMEAAGLRSLFPLSDIAVMGFLPVIARLPQLLRRIRETAQAVIDHPPDALVIIDSPDFTHRVARRVKAKLPHLPIIAYVSPSVWAWRPGRAPRMRAYVDRLLALLPFEPRVHEELGGPPCTYVGHPLIARLGDLSPSAAEARRRTETPPLLVVLPGSRRSEIARLLDTFEKTLDELARMGVAFESVLPAVDHLAGEIAARVARWKFPPRIVTGEAAKYEAFRKARAALAASGTVTLELALAHVPAVVAYKVSKLEEVVARQLVRTRWMSLPNIILGESAVPEFLQDAATPEALARHLAALLGQSREREDQLAALDRLEAQMKLDGDEPPARRAARAVLETIPRK